MSTLFGWTLEQWALAAAWYELAVGPLPAPEGCAAAQLVHHAWCRRREDKPGRVLKLVKYEYPENWPWATSVFQAAAMECAPFMGRK